MRQHCTYCGQRAAYACDGVVAALPGTTLYCAERMCADCAIFEADGEYCAQHSTEPLTAATLAQLRQPGARRVDFLIMNARYPGKCASQSCGARIQARDLFYYLLRSKRAFCAQCGEAMTTRG